MPFSCHNDKMVRCLYREAKKSLLDALERKIKRGNHFGYLFHGDTKI